MKTDDIQKTIFLAALELIHFRTVGGDYAWKYSSGGPYSDNCTKIPSDARYIELKMEGFTDYFRPKENNNWCKMLNEHCFHQWLSPEGWVTLDSPGINCSAVPVYLGGSDPKFLSHFPGDNRKTLPFWGCNCNNHKGGCNGYKWGKNFTLHYAQSKKYIKNGNSNYVF